LRRYETIFILRPNLGESIQKDTIRRFEGIVRANSGEMIETDEWGFRELAYNLKGERRGWYVRLDFGGNGATMNELDRNLKLSDNVLRYLSVLVDSDVQPEAVRVDIEANRRRSAEARAAADASRAAADASRAAAAPEAAPDATAPSIEEAAPQEELEPGSSADTAGSVAEEEEQS